MHGLLPGRFQPFHRCHRQFVERIVGDVEEVDGVSRLRNVAERDQHAVGGEGPRASGHRRATAPDSR
jgi:hypothetical protein